MALQPAIVDLPFIAAEFPIPPIELSKNGRAHWAAKSRATRSYRLAAKAIFKAVRTKRKVAVREHAGVLATFYWPNKRRRDRGNAMARLEPLWDGMEDALIVLNDEGLTFYPCVFKIDKTNPRVLVEVFDVPPPEEDAEFVAIRT